jgi:SAM-dependent methyltransferase
MTHHLSRRVALSRTFRHLREHFALGEKSVLDIGCSEGHYLKHFGEGSVGVTIIPEHIEAGRASGLHIVQGNIEDPEFSLPQCFDAAWANNLFEHMNAPHLFLMKVRELVRPDGVLVLGVPVIPHVPFLTRLTKFRGAYAASHVNFFTRRTLIETVRAAGWVVSEARLFYFRNRYLDALLNVITPHVYVIAHPKANFSYPEKRLKSLRGYGKAGTF